MTQLPSIPVRNSFAPIAPMSTNTSPTAASAPVTPSPAQQAGTMPLDRPRSERALRWQKQVEEVREEERRIEEERLRRTELGPDKGKGVVRSNVAMSAPTETMATTSQIAVEQRAAIAGEAIRASGRLTRPHSVARWSLTGPTSLNPSTPRTPGGGHPDFPPLPTRARTPRMPAVPDQPFTFVSALSQPFSVVTALNVDSLETADSDNPRQPATRSKLTASSANKIPRFAEDDEDSDGFITVPLKKRKRNDAHDVSDPLTGRPLSLRPPATSSSHAPAPAPAPAPVQAISTTLEVGGERYFEPLPGTLMHSRAADACNRTKMPEGDFPIVEGNFPEHQFENVTDECRGNWLACKDPKMFTQVFGTNACGDPGQISDISAYLRQGLEAVSGESNFRVSPPVAATPPATTNDPPFHYLVTNPNPAVILALIKQRIHSLENPPITFECSPIDSRAPYLICTLRGFSSTITKEDATDIVDSHIRNTTARTLIARQEQAKRPNDVIDPEFITRSVEGVMNTLRVEVLPYKKPGGALSPLVNVYLYTTATTSNEWFAWRNAIATTVFTSFRDGTGTGSVAIMCTNCHGMDHPTGMCPFNNVPEWNGFKGLKNIERIRAPGMATKPRGRGGRISSRGRGNDFNRRG